MIRFPASTPKNRRPLPKSEANPSSNIISGILSAPATIIGPEPKAQATKASFTIPARTTNLWGSPIGLLSPQDQKALEAEERPVVLRQKADIIIAWVEKAVGDTAVQYDLVHTALPWAAVRLLLQVSFLGIFYALLVRD